MFGEFQVPSRPGHEVCAVGAVAGVGKEGMTQADERLVCQVDEFALDPEDAKKSL
jgi:hypothetical protein